MSRSTPLPWSLRSALLASALLLAACGSFQLDPVTPSNPPGSLRDSMPISAVSVQVSPAMEPDQQRVLAKYAAAAEMERVLGLSLRAGQPGGATVTVTLESIRFSSFGPSRMHSVTHVVGLDGAVMKSFESESVSMQSKALERVAQDHVQKIADGI